MTITYDPITRKNKYTGFDAVKLYVAYCAMLLGAIAVVVGLFFLNSFRWGGCP